MKAIAKNEIIEDEKDEKDDVIKKEENKKDKNILYIDINIKNEF